MSEPIYPNHSVSLNIYTPYGN